jgi:hypothetical protein
MSRKLLFVVVEIFLIVGYSAFAYFKVSISASLALVVLAILVFNVGIFQTPSGTAGSPDGFWKPGYSFLLAAGLFALALALYEAPPTKSAAVDYVYVMPKAGPAVTPSSALTGAAGQPTVGPTPTPASTPLPTPTQTPMWCKTQLSGLDTLTPGSAAAYDLYVYCPQAAAEAPAVAVSPAPGSPGAVGWLSVKQMYSPPVVEDQGRTYYTFFLVEVQATPLPAGVVHTLFAPEITTKSGAGKMDQDHAFPVLPITIRQTRSIEDIKALITSVGGALAALMSLLIGLLTFLRGETRN